MFNLIQALPVLGLAVSAAAQPHGHNHQRFHTRDTSGKRGLAYNDASLTTLFSASGSKVSWIYNWASTSSGGDSSYEFVPMLHSNSSDDTANWSSNVEKAISAGSTHIMSVNEPDQCGSGTGGACMQDVASTVAFHKQYVQPFAGKVKIGAPAVTNGEKDSSTGSVMGLPWLKEFLSQCTDCEIDFISIHWYDAPANVDSFKQHVQDAYTTGGNKSVWITEFAPSSGTDDEKATFLKTVLPWLDSQDYVERYAYQMTAKDILVNTAGNGLTTLGSTYNTA